VAPALFAISPALFVPNLGQWADPSVRFVHDGSGANVAMTASGPVFQLLQNAPVATSFPLVEDPASGTLAATKLWPTRGCTTG